MRILCQNEHIGAFVSVGKAFTSKSLTKALQTLKSDHFDTESSQVWQWKIDPHNPTVSKMVWTCPNRSQTSKLIIGNTFWNSISDIRITFKKCPQPPSLKKEILTSKNNQSLREEIIEPSNVYLVPSGDIYAFILKKFSFPSYVVCRVRQKQCFYVFYAYIARF